MTNRIEDSSGNEPPLNFFNETIFPLMLMASLEPLQLTEKSFFNLGLPHHNHTYNLNLSVFKREEHGPAHLFFVISSSNNFTPPELFSTNFPDAESEEAKNFMLRPIEKFRPFKRAILLFEKRPHLLKEYEEMVIKWKESLREVL